MFKLPIAWTGDCDDDGGNSLTPRASAVAGLHVGPACAIFAQLARRPRVEGDVIGLVEASRRFGTWIESSSVGTAAPFCPRKIRYPIGGYEARFVPENDAAVNGSRNAVISAVPSPETAPRHDDDLRQILRSAPWRTGGGSTLALTEICG
jgi:hypothetical protein